MSEEELHRSKINKIILKKMRKRIDARVRFHCEIDTVH